MAERVKALLLYDDPDRMILGSTLTLVTLLHPWLGGFEQAANLIGSSQTLIGKLGIRSTPKRARTIRPK